MHDYRSITYEDLTMCTGSAPSAPPPPPRVPEAPVLPEQRAAGVSDLDARRRRTAAGQADGRSTILTGARGVTTGGATAQKTLLGQ